MPESANELTELLRALATREAAATPTVTLGTVTGQQIVELAFWPGTDEAVSADLLRIAGVALPETGGRALRSGGTTAFRVGPRRVWLAAPEAAHLGEALLDSLSKHGALVPLGHARAILRLTGAAAADVLSEVLTIDLDPLAFPDGAFATTALGRVGILVHRVGSVGGACAFDLYLPRSYAQWLASLVIKAAEPYGVAADVA
ncbi:MAG: hypothetical protein KDJ41_00545 [Hyphomicrobiaceae bacterium]|nr:hypothetical protein [Hyphomicrobiaceae bacterium]